MAKDLIWPARPILSLVNDYNAEGSPDDQTKTLYPIDGGAEVEENDPSDTPAVWNGPATETFSDTSSSNVLKLRVRFKAREPYAKTATFLIVIDRFVPDTDPPWQREIRDSVSFNLPERHLDKWYYCEREYTLSQDIPLLAARMKKNTKLTFRVDGRIWTGGAMNTGSGGSSGAFGPSHRKEFTAVLKPPKLELAKAEYEQMLEAMQNRLHQVREQLAK